MTKKVSRLLAVLAVLLGLGLVQVAIARAQQPPPGNNGTVKIHEGANEPTPITRNETHVCTFHVHALNFDPGQELTFTVRSWPPTGDGTVVLNGSITANAQGNGRAPGAGNAYSLPDGHYRLTVDTGNGRPTQDKHKMFWVECGPTTTQPTTTTTEPPTTTEPTTTLPPTSTTQGGTTTTQGETTTTTDGGVTTTTKDEGTTTTRRHPDGEPTTTRPGGPGGGEEPDDGDGPGGPGQPELPFTGGPSVPLLIAGLGLIGLGASSLLATRLRRQ